MDAVVYQEHSREVTLAIKGFKIVTLAFTLAAVVVGIIFGIIDGRAGLFILDIVTIGLVAAAAFLVNKKYTLNHYLFIIIIIFNIFIYFILYLYLI